MELARLHFLYHGTVLTPIMFAIAPYRGGDRSDPRDFDPKLLQAKVLKDAPGGGKDTLWVRESVVRVLVARGKVDAAIEVARDRKPFFFFFFFFFFFCWLMRVVGKDPGWLRRTASHELTLLVPLSRAALQPIRAHAVADLCQPIVDNVLKELETTAEQCKDYVATSTVAYWAERVWLDLLGGEEPGSCLHSVTSLAGSSCSLLVSRCSFPSSALLPPMADEADPRR